MNLGVLQACTQQGRLLPGRKEGVLMYARITTHSNKMAVSIMHGLPNLITKRTQYMEVCLAYYPVIASTRLLPWDRNQSYIAIYTDFNFLSTTLTTCCHWPA